MVEVVSAVTVDTVSLLNCTPAVPPRLSASHAAFGTTTPTCVVLGALRSATVCPYVSGMTATRPVRRCE